MKIEIGESIASSYLRHVKRCWLVQTNWKASAWGLEAPELKTKFQEMRKRFDPDGGVFIGTKNVKQFLTQAEIDVVGVDQHGRVYAMEVAFHEAGLHYSDTCSRVLKKMLRTFLVLRAYHERPTPLSIYFLSPKVRSSELHPLEKMFDELRATYPCADWHLVVNDDFADCVVKRTLKGAMDGADSGELAVRTAKLLKLAGLLRSYEERSDLPIRQADGSHRPAQLQPLIKALMDTLLPSEGQSPLNEGELRKLANSEYCKNTLRLKVGSLALIRPVDQGREVGGHPRYWAKSYGGFYVCSQWGRAHHVDNARCLLEYIQCLAQSKPAHEEALNKHASAFEEYIGRNQA